MKTRYNKIFLALKTALIVPVGVAMLAPNMAGAVNYSANVSSGSWATNSTWSPSTGNPTSLTSDTATISRATGSNVQLNATKSTRVLTVGGAAAANLLQIGNTGAATLNVGTGGTIINDLGTVQVFAGRSIASALNAFTVNNGGVLANAGSVAANAFTNNAGGTTNVTGTGSLAVSSLINGGTMTGSGGASLTVNPGGSLINQGTITIADASFTASQSSVSLDGGDLSLSNLASNPAAMGSLNVNGGTLTLGTGAAVQIESDYTNSAFVVGSGFNWKAGLNGVTTPGTNFVSFDPKNQAITVTGGNQVINPNDATIGLGNVHTQDSVTANGGIGQSTVTSSNTYAIDNIGSSTTIRGTVDGTGATDTRITGSSGQGNNALIAADAETDSGGYLANGITAAGSSSAISLQFHGDSAGSASAVTDQFVTVKNNFGEEQKINIRGIFDPPNLSAGPEAWNLAHKSADQGDITILNQHVGNNNAGVAQAVTVANDSAATYSESLRATLGVTSPAVIVSGGPTVNVAGGASDNSISLGVNTGAAGAQLGAAGFALSSQGGAVAVAGVSSGLGATNLTSDTFNVGGNVYDYAKANLAQTSGSGLSGSGNSWTLNFGDVVKNTTASATLQLGNLGAVGFTDKLGGTFTATSLATEISLTGGWDLGNAIARLNAGATLDGLIASITSSVLGHYEKTITFVWDGLNDKIGNTTNWQGVASGEGNTEALSLLIKGDIVNFKVPEPGMLWLFGSAGLGWFATNKIKTEKA